MTTKATLCLAVLLLGTCCMAQDQAKFWTKKQIALQSLNTGLRVTDAVATCHTLAIGGREQWLPTQSCAGASAWILSAIPASIALSYLLHKRHHNKLALGVPVIYSVVDAGAVVRSLK